MASQYEIDRLTHVEHCKRTGEPSNRQRAQWAGNGLETFRVEVMPFEDNFTTLSDFLGNLMHWAKRNKVNFDRAMSNGRDQFEAETWQEMSPKQRKGKKRPVLAEG